jgi:transcription factor E2F7/8
MFDSFLRLFSNEQETWGGVCLDSAAKKLHVERRRIYDIVNVLESVEIVARRAKNKYAWFGMTRLPQAIERLRNATSAELNQEPADRQAAEAALGVKNAAQMSGNTFSPANKGNTSAIHDATSAPEASVVNTLGEDSIAINEDASRATLGALDSETGSAVAKDAIDQGNQTEAVSTEDEGRQCKSQVASAASAKVPWSKETSVTGDPKLDESYHQFLEMYHLARASRREKSLGVLSQKFVQLFLNSEHGVVSLEPAARKLLEEDTFNDEGQLKTKIRRLYDIANILCSLNLVLLPSLTTHVSHANTCFRSKRLLLPSFTGNLRLNGFMIQQKPITDFAILAPKLCRSHLPPSKPHLNLKKNLKNPNLLSNLANRSHPKRRKRK